jgi:hypothetical protein
VVVLQFKDGKVSAIRDFRYARYATESPASFGISSAATAQPPARTLP